MLFKLFDKDDKTEQTKEDGTNSAGAQPVDEAQAVAEPGKEESAEAGKIEAPFHGFDSEGEYFIVKVHHSFGYIFILGWLLKSADWLKMYVAKQAIEQKKSQIIRPGFRGFNPNPKGK